MSAITINHIAIVVPDLASALPFWRDALGLPADDPREVAQEEVRIVFLDAGEAHIELVEPTTATSGISRYLEKRGQGIHHICLEVDDIVTALQRLAEHGVELINETPRERDGRQYAFIHPRSTGGVLVELYQRLA